MHMGELRRGRRALTSTLLAPGTEITSSSLQTKTGVAPSSMSRLLMAWRTLHLTQQSSTIAQSS